MRENKLKIKDNAEKKKFSKKFKNSDIFKNFHNFENSWKFSEFSKNAKYSKKFLWIFCLVHPIDEWTTPRLFVYRRDLLRDLFGPNFSHISCFDCLGVILDIYW